MRQLYLLLIFVIYVTSAFGQSPQEDRMNFVPGELIIKLKDEVNEKLKYSSTRKTTSSLDLKAFLDIDADFEKVSVMFSEKSIKKSLDNKKKMMQKAAMKKSVNPNDGSIAEPPLSLKNIFKVKLKSTQDPSQVLNLIRDLKQNPDVEFAEPNYRFSINDFTINSKIFTEEDLKNIKGEEKALSSLVPNDALYGQQTNISNVNIDKVWESGTTGDGSQVIAILDTGVDYNHPDLKDNIWINEAELNGVEGFDDDGNGYVDDIYGWDFINIDSEPLDDNMHGTHVAGIAGAVGNNELGIAGAAWNVKLMPVKVFQSNGVGNATTIAEGIEYAANNGATVINMSFGTYAESMTMKAALENAYATSVLVASAGNDRTPIGPCIGCKPYYPAAYTFVLGVEDGGANYDNFDQDGPLFSGHPGLLNYEINAPGTGILSTVPDGGYRNLTGTSMAAPLLAGSCALYNEIKNPDNKEILFGDFINSSNDKYFDLLAAINTDPASIIKIYSVAFDDDFETNQYIDGFINAGETINIFSSVRNFWGTSGNIQMSIDFGGNGLQNDYYASILNITDSTSTLPSLSNYAYNINTTDPFKIEIKEGVPHNTEVEFLISAWDEDLPNKVDTYKLTISVKNIQKIVGPINNDITIYPGSYLIDEMVIVDDATVSIMPGVSILFENYGRFKKLNNSFINAIGSKDEMINLISDRWRQDITVEVDNCTWCVIDKLNLTHSDSQNNTYSYSKISGSVKGNVSYSNVEGYIYPSNTNFSYQLNNIIHGSLLYFKNGTKSNLLWERPGGLGSPLSTNYIVNGLILAKNEGNSIEYLNDIFIPLLGNQELLNDWIIWDLSDAAGSSYPNSSTNIINIDNLMNLPHETTPPFLWKLEINNKLAYYSPDSYLRRTISSFKTPEYDPVIFQTDPIGVGSHEFKLYFNHPMDTSINPIISYGIIEPYNQKIISEEGSWSADGKIYTVIHDVNIGAADGINRIKISGAKDLIYEWEIPMNQNHHFTLQSSGSASTGFFAKPGLGKIELDWEEPTEEELNDVLGYNMFRYQIDEEGNETETIKLNESLITTSEFADFEVTEGETYFYKYKILRTSLEETDFSQTISTQPLTSVLGDSNGDFGVNVMDVIQNVDYILGHNPKPFILQAADVNADGSINVLDVVGVVDIILNPDGGTGTNANTGEINYYPSEPVGKAVLSWEGDDLYIESEHQIGGLQLSISSDFDYTVNEDLSNLERLNYEQDGNEVLMLYSFNNVSFGEGKVKLLSRIDASQEMEFVSAVVSTVSGAKLEATFEEGTLSIIDAPEQLDTMDFGKLYPNPSNGLLNVEYYLPGQVETVSLSIYNLQGQLVFSDEKLRNVSGINTHTMNLETISGGVYVVVLNAMNNGRIAHRQFKKLVIE